MGERYRYNFFANGFITGVSPLQTRTARSTEGEGGGGGASRGGRADQSLAVAVGGGRFKAYVNILESMRVCVCVSCTWVCVLEEAMGYPLGP